jgi:hypothetical protein
MKIKHDYKCQECGKVATHNIQDGGQVHYAIKEDGEFKLLDSWAEGDENNDFYCDKCYDEADL